MHAATLTDALDELAADRPDVAVAFPSMGEEISVRELADASRAIAASLVARGVAPGDRVGVLSRNSPSFLTLLFAVARAGAAACPLPLPTSVRDLGGYATRLTSVIAVADIRRVVVDEGLRGVASRLEPALAGAEVVTHAQLAADARGGALPAVAPADLAIVQFTSGSTAVPKGVALTHRNVMAGIRAIAEGIDIRPGDRGGLWLPLFHDMGLFGTLSGTFAGIRMSVWSPAAFVKNPGRWLREFLAEGGTMSTAPNFGYESLVAAVPPDEVRDLDMRAWRVALNGAEPIPVPALERFLDHFAPAGFQPSSLLPVYGMAEATLAVTFPPLGRPPVTISVDRDRLAGDGVARDVGRDDPRARGLVGLGRPVRGIETRVVDALGAPLPDGRVGEIQIRGESVTSGYLTAAANTKQDPVDGWIETGDLGFQRFGDLFVTGRRKEMIIVRGVNFYPEDAESAVRDAPGLHRRRCVAFADSDADGAENITILGETALGDPAARARLADDLRAAVSVALGLREVAVHLVAPDVLPRTSSGKFQRLAAREMARAGASGASDAEPVRVDM
jgi:acyl-CoA synthetase (AMP-forming)/AMP-acid ligase II